MIWAEKTSRCEDRGRACIGRRGAPVIKAAAAKKLGAALAQRRPGRGRFFGRGQFFGRRSARADARPTAPEAVLLADFIPTGMTMFLVFR